MLKIYIDFKSPASYLAMKPTLALIAQHDWDVTWLPFRSKQDPMTKEYAEETKTERHLRVRADARRSVHLRYAEVQGVTMAFRADSGETDLALAALLTVKSDPIPFAMAAFRAYWAGGADLNELRVVANLLNDAGYGPIEFEPKQALDSLEQVQCNAAEEKVIDAPAYVLSDQVFIGREHLPWIRELMG